MPPPLATIARSDAAATSAGTGGAVSRAYVARVLVAVTIVAGVWGLLHALDIIVLVFGAVLVAVVLRTLSMPLARRIGGRPRIALAIVVLGLLVATVLASWLIGDQVATQLQSLRDVLPRAFQAVTQWLNTHAAGLALLDLWERLKSDQTAWTRLAGMASVTLNVMGAAALTLVVGIYLAADPALYRRGLLRLLPHAQRPRVDDALNAAGHGLSRWLMGQGLSMLAIGTMTAAGLWLLDMPQALSLGLIAGLLAFVPLFGAIAAGVLIVLLAFTQGPTQALYVAILCIGVQQIEEYLLTPFIHRWAVALPPALGLLSVVVFGAMFGLVGVLVATPMMVVAMIMVDKLYVDGVIEERAAPAPGPARAPAPAGAQRNVAR